MNDIFKMKTEFSFQRLLRRTDARPGDYESEEFWWRGGESDGSQLQRRRAACSSTLGSGRHQSENSPSSFNWRQDDLVHFNYANLCKPNLEISICIEAI